MKIVALVRTYNNQREIAYFCNSYKYLDKILVFDRGSTDNTLLIAKCYPNVEIRSDDEVVFWEVEEDADWIINGNVECRPNSYLKYDYPSIMRNTNKDFISVDKVFHNGKFFYPDLSHKVIWAWKTDANLTPEKHRTNYLSSPYCLLEKIPEQKDTKELLTDWMSEQ